MKPVAGQPAADAVAVPGARSHVSAGRGRIAILGVGWSALNTGSALLISVIVFIITSRLMGPQEFGVVALAISIITVVGCATPGGFGEAIIQRVEIADEHLDTVFWLCVGSGLIFFVPIVLLADTVAEIAGEPILTLLLPYFGVKMILDLVAVVPQALIVRAMKFKHIAARTAIGNSISGLICILMALNGYGVWALAMAPMITSVVSLAILVWAARWMPGFRVRVSAVRDLLRFGLFASANNALYFLNIDRLVLGFLAGPAVLGLYFLGKRLFDLLNGVTSGVIQPVTTVFFASIQKEPDTHIRALRNALRATVIISFPVFGGLLSVADSAVPLVLGDHWIPAVPAVQAFAIIGLFAALVATSHALATGLGRADLPFIVDLLRNLLAVLAILLFLNQGFLAVMAALVAAHAVMLPGTFLIARKLTGVSLRQYLEPLVMPMLGTVAMCAVLQVLPGLLPEAGPAMILTAQIVVGATVYLGIMLSLSGREIAELKQTFSREAAGE